MFSPPLFSTINKTLDFYEDTVRSELRFGVVQLNKPIDEEVYGMLSSVGTVLNTNTDEEKLNRCFNIAISEYGKLTNNPAAESQFVNMLTRQKFRCSLQQLTDTFGPGIYILSTCSPLALSIKGIGMGKIKYSSEVGIKTALEHNDHKQMVDKVVYAFNNDLEQIVHNLNYRWLDMVRDIPELEPAYTIPSIDVQMNKQYPNYAEAMFDREIVEQPPKPYQEPGDDEIATQPDPDQSYMEDEIATQPDPDQSYMEMEGGKRRITSKKQSRRQKQTKPTLTRKQTKPQARKQTKRQSRTRKQKSRRTNPRRARSLRRSKYYPSRA
jgi:hypothetical protein